MENTTLPTSPEIYVPVVIVVLVPLCGAENVYESTWQAEYLIELYDIFDSV